MELANEPKKYEGRGKHGHGPNMSVPLGVELKSKIFKYCDLQGLVPSKYVAKVLRDFFADVDENGVQVESEEQ